MAAAALDEPGELIADDLKGCMLCYELRSAHGVAGVVDLEALHDRIAAGLDDVVCMDAAQYGVEHVPMPSDFIAWGFDHFASPEMSRWIGAEKQALCRRLPASIFLQSAPAIVVNSLYWVREKTLASGVEIHVNLCYTQHNALDAIHFREANETV